MGISLNPSLGGESLSIATKDRLVTVRNPYVSTDYGLLRLSVTFTPYSMQQ